MNCRRWSFLVCCLGLALAPPATAQKGKGSGGNGATTRAVVTIHDAFPGAGAGVVSDGKGSYTDSQLGGDPCVFAYVKNDGFFSFRTDYTQETGAGCNALLGTVADGTARTFTLRFPDGHAACSQLNLTSNGTVCSVDLDPETADASITVPKLFDPAASKSQVRFRFLYGGSYWLVVLAEVNVNPAQNPQTITSLGPAKLFNDDKGKNGGFQVGKEFTFALEITVERVP